MIRFAKNVGVTLGISVLSVSVALVCAAEPSPPYFYKANILSNDSVRLIAAAMCSDQQCALYGARTDIASGASLDPDGITIDTNHVSIRPEEVMLRTAGADFLVAWDRSGLAAAVAVVRGDDGTLVGDGATSLAYPPTSDWLVWSTLSGVACREESCLVRWTAAVGKMALSIQSANTVNTTFGTTNLLEDLPLLETYVNGEQGYFTILSYNTFFNTVRWNPPESSASEEMYVDVLDIPEGDWEVAIHGDGTRRLAVWWSTESPYTASAAALSTETHGLVYDAPVKFVSLSEADDAALVYPREVAGNDRDWLLLWVTEHEDDGYEVHTTLLRGDTGEIANPEDTLLTTYSTRPVCDVTGEGEDFAAVCATGSALSVWKIAGMDAGTELLPTPAEFPTPVRPDAQDDEPEIDTEIEDIVEDETDADTAQLESTDNPDIEPETGDTDNGDTDDDSAKPESSEPAEAPEDGAHPNDDMNTTVGAAPDQGAGGCSVAGIGRRMSTLAGLLRLLW